MPRARILSHSLFDSIFTCAHAASKYCLWRRLSGCASVRTKSRKLLLRNWCNLVRMCPMVNARRGSKLLTFDLDLWHWELFLYFLNSAIYLEGLDLATSFSVWRYIFRISRSQFSFKVIGLRSRSRWRISNFFNSSSKFWMSSIAFSFIFSVRVLL